MAVFVSKDAVRQVICIRVTGTLGDAEAVPIYTRLARWFATHGYYNSITDLTGVTSFTVSVRVVRELAANAPLVPNGYLRVMVAPQDSVFGSARMYEMAGSGTRDEVHVVRNMQEACRLFGVESLDLQPLEEW